VVEASRVSEARLSISLLRTFVVAAEELNFRRAAERLYVAYSPLSRRIRDLEAAVGAPLFERDTRNVRLTAAGETLLPLARDVLARLDALTTVVRVEQGGGVVHLGHSYGTHPAERAELIRAARLASGGGEVLVEASLSPTLLRRLSRRELDVCIVHNMTDLSGFGTLLLREEPFAAVLAADHPLAGHSLLEVSELRDMRCVTVDYHPFTSLQMRMFEALKAAGVEGAPVFVEELNAIPSRVAASHSLFALLPASADTDSPLRRYFSDPGIVELPLTGYDVTFRTYIAWLVERESEQPIAAIVEEMKALFGARESVAVL